jgi:hypothetical protein
MPTTISPRPGFDWSKVNWGGPDQQRTEVCSYCGDALPDQESPNYEIPLILWNSEGWCAEFCGTCQATWWGIQSFDEIEPRHEPEVRGVARRR